MQRTRQKLKREADAEKLHHINSVQQLSSMHDSNGSFNNGSDGTLLPPVKGGGSGESESGTIWGRVGDESESKREGEGAETMTRPHHRTTLLVPTTDYHTH